MLDIMVKSTIGKTELSVKTTVDNEDEAKKKLKELYELVKASKKEIFPQNEPKIPQQSPSFGASSPGNRI